MFQPCDNGKPGGGQEGLPQQQQQQHCLTGPPGIGVTETMALVPHHPQHTHPQVSCICEMLVHILEKHVSDTLYRLAVHRFNSIIHVSFTHHHLPF
jgi:hypothetical protein